MNEKILSKRIENYWDARSEDFGKIRRVELCGENFTAWQRIFQAHLLSEKSLKILDVGTGAGFFAIILSKLGHKVIGTDTSEKMLAQAKKISAEFDCSAEFFKMDAQNLIFPDETFDAIVSRNLTWTLPDVMEAYREWHRVLKVGGMLMNFDSDVGRVTFEKKSAARDVHANISEDLLTECNAIKSELKISTHGRPTFDAEFLKTLNFSVELEADISEKVQRDKNCLYDSIPLFAVYAKKIELKKIFGRKNCRMKRILRP